MAKRYLVTTEIAAILDQYARYVMAYEGEVTRDERTKAIVSIAELMLDNDRVSLLRAAIVEPVELVDIVDVTTGRF